MGAREQPLGACGDRCEAAANVAKFYGWRKVCTILHTLYMPRQCRMGPEWRKISLIPCLRMSALFMGESYVYPLTLGPVSSLRPLGYIRSHFSYDNRKLAVTFGTRTLAAVAICFLFRQLRISGLIILLETP